MTNTTPVENKQSSYICDFCPVRQSAAENPRSLKARFWRLHTNFCPMWKSYQQMTGAEKPTAPDKGDKILALTMMFAMTLIPLSAWWLKRRQGRIRVAQ